MEIGELVVRLTANSTGLTAGLSKASGSVAAFGKRMQSVGSSMTRFVTLPVLAVGGAAIHAALDFEKAMTNIRALVGESAKTVAAYRQEIMKLAPALGKSPQELGEALYFITSSGFKGAAALRVLTASAKASAAGLGETQIIAQAVGAAVNAYGEKSLSASRATDILLAAVREGTGEAADYATAIGRVIPIAQVMGVSFGEVAGTMAALSLNGTSAHEAVVQITAGLAQAIKPTKQGTDALKSLGMSYGDLRREIKDKGLAQVFEDLKEKFHGNVEEIGKVFGNIRALRGVLTLSGVSAEKYGGIIDRVTKSQGDVNKAFAITSETAGFKLHKALAKLQVVGIQIGDKLVPALVRVAEWVGRMADGFSKLSEGTQGFIIKAALLTAALGPLLSIGGRVIGMLASLRTATLLAGAASGAVAAGGMAEMAVAARATTRAFGYTVPVLGATAVGAEKVAVATAKVAAPVTVMAGRLTLLTTRLGLLGAALTAGMLVFPEWRRAGETAFGWIGGAIAKLQALYKWADWHPAFGAPKAPKVYSRPDLQPVVPAPHTPLKPDTTGGGSRGLGRAAGAMAQVGLAGGGNITIPIYLDGRQIAEYAVDLANRSARRRDRGYS